jgi:hypothetical protein
MNGKDSVPENAENIPSLVGVSISCKSNLR